MAISKLSTFSHGVHIPDMKYLSSGKAIEIMPAPKLAYISLSQHIGRPAQPVVEVGDEVKKGQLIGKASAFVSANVYSSVSGKVKEIKSIVTHAGKMDYVIVENDETDEEVFLPDIDKTDGKQILDRIADAGIVGMGGAGFPTSVKYAPQDPVDTVLINGAECEPYLTCDHRVMLEKTEEFVKGAGYLSLALGGAKVLVGIEENKKDAIDLLAKYDSITVVPLKKKYPQGSEKQLIFACTGRKVAPGKLPASAGVCVSNVQTVWKTYEAVELNKPLYERVMTVTGQGINEPKNLLVRLGTPYEEIIAFCGGMTEDARKVVAGGPMMGRVLSTLTAYTRKTDSGLLIFKKGEANEFEPSPCINCGRCAAACPMHLMPMYIDLFTNTGNYERAASYGVMNCFECGTCAYVCPAKRDLVGSMQTCKKKLKEMQG